MNASVRNYALVTSAYWAFTVTDGALRMLVLLYFHNLGYSPLEVALLFLFYEFFGIVTNLLGGWIGARLGLRFTLYSGLTLQIGALCALALLPAEWPKAGAVAFVMAMQALSGIAKDLTKMSSKSAVKLVVPEGKPGRLFHWVALLTGSKNALKGVGFFVGALLLQFIGFAPALFSLAGLLFVALIVCAVAMRGDLGRSSSKPKFREMFSKSSAINRLSAARMFLFGARDVWFVVAVPVFLHETLGWPFLQVGGFMACWVIGYGMVQASAPGLLRRLCRGEAPAGRTAAVLAFLLGLVMGLLALSIQRDWGAVSLSILVGLAVFGLIFALNSSVHSFLVVAYSDRDKVVMNVGFYYMANAAGRLGGTVLSGWLFQQYALAGCLWASFGLALVAALFSLALPRGVEEEGKIAAKAKPAGIPGP